MISTALSPLDNVSSFPFENCLGQLIMLLRNASFPLQQIIRRMSEKKDFICKSIAFPLLKKEHSHGPLVKNVEPTGHQYEELSTEQFCIKISSKNNGRDSCLGLKTGAEVIVEDIIKNEVNFYTAYKQFAQCNNLFVYPYKSSDLGLFKVRGLEPNLRRCSLSNVTRKYVLFPTQGVHAVIPLIHL